MSPGLRGKALSSPTPRKKQIAPAMTIDNLMYLRFDPKTTPIKIMRQRTVSIAVSISDPTIFCTKGGRSGGHFQPKLSEATRQH
jgi:hypothetical protein